MVIQAFQVQLQGKLIPVSIIQMHREEARRRRRGTKGWTGYAEADGVFSGPKT
jgi:hypothetical protein